MTINGWWEYRIRAYRPPNQGGGLLIETVHRGESSRDMEIDVFRARMARGEVGHIDVISLVPPYGTETIYPVILPAKTPEAVKEISDNGQRTP